MNREAMVFFICFVFTSSAFAGTWRDDFEDGNLNGWDLSSVVPPEKWNVEDGECRGEYFNAPPGLISVIWIGNVGWKDYLVKCKMKFAIAGEFAGISFRDNMGGERYGFVINMQTNTAQAWKVFQGAIVFPSEIPLSFILSKDTWYELKVITNENHFEFYIDGKLANEFEDKSISSGKVGLTVRNAHNHFDDFIFTGDDVQDGGSWDPAKHPEEKAVEAKGKLATRWGEIKL